MMNKLSYYVNAIRAIIKPKLPQEVLDDLACQKLGSENIQKNTLDILMNPLQKMFFDLCLEDETEINIETAKEFVDRGVILWNEILDIIGPAYEQKKAIVFKIITTEHDLRIIEEYNSLYLRKKRKHLYSKQNAYSLFRRRFVAFSNRKFWCNLSNKKLNTNKEKPVVFAVGELASLMNGANIFIHRLKGLRDNTKGVTLITTPITVYNKLLVNGEMLNDFVYQLTTHKKVKTDKKLYKNRLLPLDIMIAGYFHFYVVGDNILTEVPHEYRSSFNSNIARYRFIINNRRLANKFRDFARDYTETKNRFVIEMNPDELKQVRPENTKPLAAFYDFVVYHEDNRDKHDLERGLEKMFAYRRMLNAARQVNLE